MSRVICVSGTATISSTSSAIELPPTCSMPPVRFVSARSSMPGFSRGSRTYTVMSLLSAAVSACHCAARLPCGSMVDTPIVCATHKRTLRRDPERPRISAAAARAEARLAARVGS